MQQGIVKQQKKLCIQVVIRLLFTTITTQVENCFHIMPCCLSMIDRGNNLIVRELAGFRVFYC